MLPKKRSGAQKDRLRDYFLSRGAPADSPVEKLIDSLRERTEHGLEASRGRPWLDAQFAAADKERFWWRLWRFRRLHHEFGWKFWALISGGAWLSETTEELLKGNECVVKPSRHRWPLP